MASKVTATGEEGEGELEAEVSGPEGGGRVCVCVCVHICVCVCVHVGKEQRRADWGNPIALPGFALPRGKMTLVFQPLIWRVPLMSPLWVTKGS